MMDCTICTLLIIPLLPWQMRSAIVPILSRLASQHALRSFDLDRSHRFAAHIFENEDVMNLRASGIDLGSGEGMGASPTATEDAEVSVAAAVSDATEVLAGGAPGAPDAEAGGYDDYTETVEPDDDDSGGEPGGREAEIPDCLGVSDGGGGGGGDGGGLLEDR